MAKVELDAKTLRWLARQAAREKDPFPMHQYMQGLNAAFERVRVICLAEARAIEKAKKGKR